MTRPAIDQWLNSLPPAQLSAMAADYAKGLAEDGLTVYDAGNDRFVPIPPMLTPRIVDDAAFAAFAADARVILESAVRAAKYTLIDAPELGERLYATLSPLEKAALAYPERLDQVATARVDAFGDPATAQVLELNATIPAMQGYSDIVLKHWLRVVCAARGLPAPEAPSNTQDLLDSLVAHWGGKGLPSIAIVSRRGDAQLGELRWYEKQWNAAGARAQHVWADEITRKDGRLYARGEPFDLLYRHIFGRRIDPASDLAAILADPGGIAVRNPLAAPLEVKGLLALLHEAAFQGELADRIGLTGDQVEVLRRRIPWTRLLEPGPFAAWVAENRARLVLKKSWDYGGKAVILGPDAEQADWEARIGAAAIEPGAWVVQEYVKPVAERHLLVAGEPRWTDVYVDLNAYAGMGPSKATWGVCRASGSKVVNILGGGGLTPLVPASAAAKLFP
jgi:hypothetical protein